MRCPGSTAQLGRSCILAVPTDWVPPFLRMVVSPSDALLIFKRVAGRP